MKHSDKSLRNFVGTLLFTTSWMLATWATAASPACGNSCIPSSSWQAFNAFSTNITHAESNDYVSFRGHFDRSNNDFAMDIESYEGGTTRKGSLMLFGGKILAVKGDVFSNGPVIDVLDSGVLMQQLVIKLLTKALPKGAPDGDAVTNINHTETKDDIHVATASAHGEFKQPWHVEGTVGRDVHGQIDYALRFASTPPVGTPAEPPMVIRGYVTKDPNFSISDATSLEAWTVERLGMEIKRGQGMTQYGYGALNSPTEYKTVADIRLALKASGPPH